MQLKKAEKKVEEKVVKKAEEKADQSVSEGDYSMQRGAQKLSMTVDEFKQEMIKAGYRIMEVPVQ